MKRVAPVVLGRLGADGWGGLCSTGVNCSIGSFKTTDPTLQEWGQGQIIAPGRASWNVDISTGRPRNDGSKTYVLAIEQQPLAGAPAGSGEKRTRNLLRAQFRLMERLRTTIDNRKVQTLMK